MTPLTLSDLGWSNRLAVQLAGRTEPPARVAAVARDRLTAFTPSGALALTLPGALSAGDVAVGDWVVYDPATLRVMEVLERATVLQRRAAGTDARPQLIAANVDTLGIVTACNADFNEARLERYLALAAAAGCLPLVIITRADEAADAGSYRRRAEALSPLVAAVTLDARDPGEVARIHPWCQGGQTLALVGSSGVGKTTLSNGLTGQGEATQAIRTDDAKGRHTTTARALWRTVAGGWLIDTPGMRALRLTEADEGIESVFAEISDLAAHCRFSDCQHETEPGCAVQAALDAGDLSPGRLQRWRKLQREDARNSESIAEARARDKVFGKMVREVIAHGRKHRGR